MAGIKRDELIRGITKLMPELNDARLVEMAKLAGLPT
jgi:hypothetical protein